MKPALAASAFDSLRLDAGPEQEALRGDVVRCLDRNHITSAAPGRPCYCSATAARITRCEAPARLWTGPRIGPGRTRPARRPPAPAKPAAAGGRRAAPNRKSSRLGGGDRLEGEVGLRAEQRLRRQPGGHRRLAGGDLRGGGGVGEAIEHLYAGRQDPGGPDLRQADPARPGPGRRRRL